MRLGLRRLFDEHTAGAWRVLADGQDSGLVLLNELIWSREHPWGCPPAGNAWIISPSFAANVRLLEEHCLTRARFAVRKDALRALGIVAATDPDHPGWAGHPVAVPAGQPR